VQDDALSFPTAIVPTRPGGTAIDRARKYMRAFGDPMGVLFTDMKTATREVTVYGQDGSVTKLEEPDREVRRECAKELMPYIYPKLRASEVSLGAAGGGAGGVSITINIGGPMPTQDPVAAAVDVTPAAEATPSPEEDPLA
jgi:hypothetical protein